MHLYFNGDSFVAGAELGDDILPDYPGLAYEKDNLSPEREAWFKKSRVFNNPELKKEYGDQIIKLAYQRSFPSKTAAKLNLPFTNNAKGGSSMDRIARTTLTDLVKLKSSGVDDILAFISTTNFNRSEVAVNSAESGLKDDWDCVSPRYLQKSQSEEFQAMRKYKIMYETDYHGLVNFYKNIILVQDFCKLNNIKLFWIAAAGDVGTERLDKITHNSREDFTYLKNYAKLNYSFDVFECYRKNFQDQKVWNPGGHFGEVVQDFIADELTKIIGQL